MLLVRHKLLLLILLSHIVLAQTYSFTTPPWGYFDETGHYAYARYIAVNKRLPAMRLAGEAGSLGVTADQSTQPPLYYLFAALPIFFVDVSDDLQARFTAGGPTPVVPNWQLDQFPYRGTVLALRLSRGVSTIVGVLAILFTYKAIRTALPTKRKIALYATAIQAWWPQFVMSSAAVNNDIAVALWGSLMLWIFFKTRQFADVRVRIRWYCLVVLCSLVAPFIKGTGVALILSAFLFVLSDLSRYLKSNGRVQHLIWPLIFFSGSIAAVVILIVWMSPRTFEALFARLFFDMSTGAPVYPSNTSSFTLIQAQLKAGIQLMLQNWTATFKTLFAVFGWGGLELPEYWYRISLFASVLPLIGIIFAWIDRLYRSVLFIALLFVGSSLLIGQLWLSRFSLIQPAILTSIPGRYLFPSLGAIAFLIAYGLYYLPDTIGKIGRLAVLSGIALTTVLTPWLVFVPAYRPYPLLNLQQLPSAAKLLKTPITFGNKIQLFAYAYPPQQPETRCMTTTLFWRAVAKPEMDYWLSLQVLDARLPNSEFQRTPGRGNFPTSQWQMGDVFAETYCIPRYDQTVVSRNLKIAWFLHDSTLLPISLTRKTALPSTCEQLGPCDAILDFEKIEKIGP